jgi:hypothetical protein
LRLVEDIEQLDIAQDVEMVPVHSVDDVAGDPATHFFTTTVVDAAGDTRQMTLGTVDAAIEAENGIAYTSGSAVVGTPWNGTDTALARAAFGNCATGTKPDPSRDGATPEE